MANYDRHVLPRVCLSGADCAADPEQKGQPRDAYPLMHGNHGGKIMGWTCRACVVRASWAPPADTEFAERARVRAADAMWWT